MNETNNNNSNAANFRNLHSSSYNNLSTAFDAILLAQFVPASVIINLEMEILQFRGAMSLYLQHTEGRTSFNILKMAHIEIAFELRNAIHQAIKTKRAVRKSGIEMSRDLDTNTIHSSTKNTISSEDSIHLLHHCTTARLISHKKVK